MFTCIVSRHVDSHMLFALDKERGWGGGMRGGNFVERDEGEGDDKSVEKKCNFSCC